MTRQWVALISQGSFSCREKGRPGSQLWSLSASLSFPILKASPRTIHPQGLTSACDSLLSRSLLVLGTPLILLGIVYYPQDCVLRLQMNEGSTVLCGKTDLKVQHFFLKISFCQDVRGNDTLPLIDSILKRIGSLQKAFTETLLNEFPWRKCKVFIHPGIIQRVFNECGLNSHRYFLLIYHVRPWVEGGEVREDVWCKCQSKILISQHGRVKLCLETGRSPYKS